MTFNLGGTRQTAAKTDKMEFSSWSRPDNTSRRIKYGIEYGLDFGTIKPIRTSVNINGAWFHILRTRQTTSTSYRSKIDKYAPTMPSGSGPAEIVQVSVFGSIVSSFVSLSIVGRVAMQL